MYGYNLSILPTYALFLAGLTGAAATDIELKNAAVDVRINANEGSIEFGQVDFLGKTANSANSIIAPSGSSVPLWTVEVITPSQKPQQINSTCAECCTERKVLDTTPTSAVLQWTCSVPSGAEATAAAADEDGSVGVVSFNVQINASLERAEKASAVQFQLDVVAASAVDAGKFGVLSWSITPGVAYLSDAHAILSPLSRGELERCNHSSSCDVGHTKTQQWPVYPASSAQFVASWPEEASSSSSNTGYPNVGVYVAAHDQTASWKSYIYRVVEIEATEQPSADKQKGIAVTWSQEVPNAGVAVNNTGGFRADFPVVLALFSSDSPHHADEERGRKEYPIDWFDATMVYRAWVMDPSNRIPWLSKGPIATRADFPRWMYNVTTWVNSHWQPVDIFNTSGGDPTVVRERMQHISTRFNLNANHQSASDGSRAGTESSHERLALHWYEWDLLGYTSGSNYTDCPGTDNHCGFDTHYPDYFPARLGFEKVTQYLQNDLGIHVVPYINGRIFDKSITRWTEDDAVMHAAKLTPSGTAYFVPDPNAGMYINAVANRTYNEEYGSHAPFAVMCPHTTYWQQTLADTVLKLTQELGVDGVYVDQVGVAPVAPCFDPRHNHSLGGGHSWVDGYREMSKLARAEQKKPSLLMTESHGEPFIDVINVALGFDINGVEGDTSSGVDVFGAVYGGYFVASGGLFVSKDLTAGDGNVFCRKLAGQFIYGAQLGWFSLGGRDNQKPSDALYDALMDPKYDAEIAFMRRLSDAKLIANPWLMDGRRVRDLPISIKHVDSAAYYLERSISSGGGPSLVLLFASYSSAMVTANISCALDLRRYGFSEQFVSSHTFQVTELYGHNGGVGAHTELSGTTAQSELQGDGMAGSQVQIETSVSARGVVALLIQASAVDI